MRRTYLALMTMAALTPAVVAAQSSGSAVAEATAQARINAAIEHATEVGVPAALLESKIAEGRAKGVSLTRIAAVVEQRAEVLARVHAALASRAEHRTDHRTEMVTTGELTAAADAHQGGVSLESITNLSARAGNDRAMALTVLADLVANGHASEQALLHVQTALQAGASSVRGNATSVVGVRVGGN